MQSNLHFAKLEIRVKNVCQGKCNTVILLFIIVIPNSLTNKQSSGSELHKNSSDAHCAYSFSDPTALDPTIPTLREKSPFLTHWGNFLKNKSFASQFFLCSPSFFLFHVHNLSRTHCLFLSIFKVFVCTLFSVFG